jgi:hypothetical protein
MYRVRGGRASHIDLSTNWSKWLIHAPVLLPLVPSVGGCVDYKAILNMVVKKKNYHHFCQDMVASHL